MRRLLGEILLLAAVKVEELAIIVGGSETACEYLKSHKDPRDRM